MRIGAPNIVSNMLASIQKEIESTYRIECPFLVEDFLLDESHRKDYLSHAPWLAHSQEALLVEQSPEELHVGLLFDSEMLTWSQTQDWNDLETLDVKKIGPLIEGVSHFVYLMWRAHQEQPVTQLELELQAEVDKFIIFSRELSPERADQVHQDLFDEVAWLKSLRNEEKVRYETALKLAARYCRFIQGHFLTPHRAEALFPEIRSFYRMSQTEKIRHIQN